MTGHASELTHNDVCLRCTMSAVLQAAASALAQGQVPLSWDALWEGPASPLDYMRSAVRR